MQIDTHTKYLNRQILCEFGVLQPVNSVVNLSWPENVGIPVIFHSREGDQSNLTCVEKDTAHIKYSWWSGDDACLADGNLLRAKRAVL